VTGFRKGDAMSDDRIVQATSDPDNLYWIMSENCFLYLPTRTLFKRDAVVRQVGEKEALLIEQGKVCSNLYWAPGLPTFMENCAIIDGELFDHPGNNLMNLYKGAPALLDGDPSQAGFWLELGEFLFGDDAEHLIKCLAFKMQHPDQKINHALVMGSYDQGIGKDSWLAPVRRGIGNHNFGNVTAGLAVEWTKRGFTVPILRKVITRISEVHDLGSDRFKFYDMTKDWCAAPPETVLVADKNVKAYNIQNVVLPIFSTNHLSDGMYWPAEDRRNFFAWSPRTRADTQTEERRTYWDAYGIEVARDDENKDEFWKGYWQHIKGGADAHVVAYLTQPELIADFNPGATPPHTPAWHAVVTANSNPQDAELADLLDCMGEYSDFGADRPDAVTIKLITSHKRCSRAIADFFDDNKNSRAWTHRLAAVGYEPKRNPAATDGLWRIAGRRQMIYVKREFGPVEAERVARELIERIARKGEPTPEQEAMEDFAS
jgi:hypothetical protein